MSTISGVSPASYIPAINQAKLEPVKPQQATPPVQAVVTDADNDGTKGGKIDSMLKFCHCNN
jgi:hypothetical protein